jgi:malonate transporter
MIAIVLAVLPVFLLIFVDTFVRRRGLVAEAFWAPAEALTYYVFFPALLVTTLAQADLSALDAFDTAAALVTSILAMSVVALSTGRALRLEGPALASPFQGAIRLNTYVGLAIAFAMYGSRRLDASALAVTAMIPVVNVLSVLVLLRFGAAGRSASAPAVLTQLVRNPPILACVLGIALNLPAIGLPPVLGPMLQILAHTALPLGLLAVGAGLDLGRVHHHGLALSAAVVLKLAALPALTYAAFLLFRTGPLGTFIAVAFNALPTAGSAFISSRQLGGDGELVASIITVQTGIAMVTLPVALMLFM